MNTKQEKKKVTLRLSPEAYAAAKKLARREPVTRVLTRLCEESLLPPKDESVRMIVTGATNRVVNRLGNIEDALANLWELFGVTLEVGCKYLPNTPSNNGNGDAASVLAKTRFAWLVQKMMKNMDGGESVYDRFRDSELGDYQEGGFDER